MSKETPKIATPSDDEVAQYANRQDPAAPHDAPAEDPVIAGVKLVADQLTKVLKDHGVEPIEAIGKQFDPSIHEALLHDRQSEELPGTVTQEFERGYRMHDRVLRHSKVAVAAEPPGEPTETP